MNVNDAYVGLSIPLQQYVNYSKKYAENFFLNIKSFRNTPTLFHKTSQIALSILELASLQNGKSYLPKFKIVLLTVNMHYIYNLFKYPYKLVYPITAENIDTHKLLLRLQEQINAVGENVVRNDLEKFLNQLFLKDKGYETVDEFKSDLKKFLINQPPINIRGTLYQFTSESFNSLDIALVKRSLTDRVSFYIWMIVDVGCAVLGLKTLSIINEDILSKRTSLSSSFSCLYRKSLEPIIHGSIVIALVLKILKAAHELKEHYRRPYLSSQNQKNKKSELINSIFEITFHGIEFLNSTGIKQLSPKLILIIGMIARLSGIIHILNFKPSWFKEEVN